MFENIRVRISIWFAIHVPTAMINRGYSANTRELIRIDTGNATQGHGWLYAYWYCFRLLMALHGPVHSL